VLARPRIRIPSPHIVYQRHFARIARLKCQITRAPDYVVGIDHGSFGHSPRRLLFRDLLFRYLEAIGGMPQENDAQDRHEVVAGGELRVGAEIVRRLPEVRFQLVDILCPGLTCLGPSGQ